MRCILVAAVSQNEYITNGSDSQPTHWTSAEDQQFFAAIRSKHRLFVMGENTYHHGKPKPTAGTLQVVLTHHPNRFADQSVAGQLEFHDLTPQQFVEKYEKIYDSCLILGGGRVYAEFMRSRLVNELYITVEPVTFESGIHIFSGEFRLLDLDLPKPTTQTLNTSGTLLKHYILKK